MSNLNKPPDLNNTLNMNSDQRINVLWYEFFGKMTDPDNNGLKGKVKVLESYYKNPEELRELFRGMANEEVEKELAEFAEKEKEKIKKLANRILSIIGTVFGFLFLTLMPLIPTYLELISRFWKH
jgi:uncharacterized protein YjbJ (UPF0337 family)